MQAFRVDGVSDVNCRVVWGGGGGNVSSPSPDGTNYTTDWFRIQMARQGSSASLLTPRAQYPRIRELSGTLFKF